MSAIKLGAGVDQHFECLIKGVHFAQVENALRQNFKSYGAWHHRKWVLGKGHSSINQELKLLDQFQKQDSRNFHAWNYRR